MENFKIKKKYNDSYLIFLGAGIINQKYCINKAHKMGIKLILVDGKLDKNDYPYCDILLKIDFVKNEKKLLNWLIKNKINLIGVMSYCNEAGMKLAAKIRFKYKLPGMKINITNKMSNKILQRQIWSKAKLPCPKWKMIESEKQYKNIYKIIEKLRFPLIIKPADAAGGRGVIKIESHKDILKNIIKSMKFSKIKNVIIEEYMEGTEFTVESFTVNGKTIILAVTKKFKVPGTNKTVAKQLESIDNKDYLYKHFGNLIIKALKALNFKDGPAHSEIIYNKDNGNKILVETAGRGGGFKIFESLIPAITGFDATKASILQSINKNIKIPKLSNNYAILKWLPNRKGTVKSFKGFDKLSKNITENTFIEGGNFVNIGDKLNYPIVDYYRIGYLLCWGNKKDEVRKILKKSQSQIKFQII